MDELTSSVAVAPAGLVITVNSCGPLARTGVAGRCSGLGASLAGSAAAGLAASSVVGLANSGAGGFNGSAAGSFAASGSGLAGCPTGLGLASAGVVAGTVTRGNATTARFPLGGGG